MARIETINSNDKKLPSGEIIVKALTQIGTEDASMATVLATIAKEGTLSTVEAIQFGNTVFLANRGEGNNRNKMVGRAFNVDTGKNYLNNCLEYMEYLRKKGITHYNTSFNGTEVLKLVQLMQRIVTRDTDSKVYIGEDNKGGYLAYFLLGEEPVPRVA